MKMGQVFFAATFLSILQKAIAAIVEALKPYAMRVLLLSLFLFPLLVFAQKREVFRIDSLPKAGILLNQGWKWHAGDNPEWAKVEFDDAGWEDIDPTKDIFELPQLPRSGEIGWFRIHLRIDSNLTQQMVMLIQQSGASEIYLNGKLIQHFGSLGPNRQKVKAFNPLLKPVPFPISNTHVEVLAVRYALQPGVWYSSHFGTVNRALTISLNTVENGVDTYESIHWVLIQPHPIRVGIFFSLAILYFGFYFFYRKRVVNLYFSIYLLLHAISWKINYGAYQSNQVALYFIQNNLTTILQVLGYLVMLNAIYQFLEQKRKWHFWSLILLGIISIPLAAFVHNWGWLIYGILFINLIHIDLARVSIVASRSNKKGALIIAAGSIFALFCWLIFSLQWFFPITIFGINFFDLNFLCVPISVSIYLGYDVSLTNIFLAQKLIEVETLSVEKQAILSTQNETLEQQVAERTAELLQKNTELELEASLERVRSKALAMKQSKEVLDVAAVLYDELQKLGFAFGVTSIHIIDAETGNMDTWVAGFGHENYPQSYHVPYSDHPFHKSEIEAWRNGTSYSVYQMAGVEKKDYDDFFFTQTGYKDIPDEVKKRMIETEYVTSSIAYMKHGSLFWAPTPLSEEKAQVLQRFAIVFEQAYTRFLDLQKAEAQTEQAQLNLIQIQTEKKRAEDALIALKSTQAQLIQSEKLASLGELTAGIAHEIQNPLNFVNNFAEVSAEMLDEMHEELEKGDTTEAIAIATDLKANLEKINHHGQRASSIVKGMLEHSRASTGVKAPTDLNALADEYLRLAYHGLRAKDSNFNATMETHFDPDLPKVSVIPQDIGRVLLNLINNAFYAVDEKQKQIAAVESRTPLSESFRLSESYTPTISLRTKRLDNAVEISVQDNGNGIPDAIKDKIFQPFFTTKPTGQGTGLGLSLAYDIVTKGHGGTLEVDTQKGESTTMIIRLPLQ